MELTVLVPSIVVSVKDEPKLENYSFIDTKSQKYITGYEAMQLLLTAYLVIVSLTLLSSFDMYHSLHCVVST